MKRKILSIVLLALVIAAVPLASGCQQEQKVLNIFTWADYFPQEIQDSFTAETGIKINFTGFESNEEMLMKLEAVKGGEYDIVLASDYILDIARKQGLLKELDKSKISNYANIDPFFQSHYYDPNNLYTIPYAAGTPLIVYDPNIVTFEIKGYKDLWNPELKDSIVLMDDRRNVIGMTLKSLGYSLNSTDPAELEQARAKLMELKPNVRVLDYDLPHDRMISGETSVGYMFTPQIVMALAARPELKVVYPEEGMGYGIDSVVVPVNAPNADNAYKFIEYILDPERSAFISEYELYMNCVAPAKDFLSEEYLNNHALYIPKEILGETEFMMDVGEMTPVYDEIWTEYMNLK